LKLGNLYRGHGSYRTGFIDQSADCLRTNSFEVRLEVEYICMSWIEKTDFGI
jgi:hypothetical protein